MSRRTAIKTMGAAALGAMLSMSGVSAVASCVSIKKKRLILYFTGTGNCLYVARQLADEDTELLSIPQKAIKFAKVDDDPLLANGEKNSEARYRNEHISLMDIKRVNSKNKNAQGRF